MQEKRPARPVTSRTPADWTKQGPGTGHAMCSKPLGPTLRQRTGHATNTATRESQLFVAERETAGARQPYRLGTVQTNDGGQ